MSYFFHLLASSGGGALPDPRNVANFIASSSSHATAAIRRSEVEITSGGVDQTRTWVFWVKGDNLSKLNEKPWSCSDTAQDQYCATWVGPVSTTANLPLKLRWDIAGASGGFLEIETTAKILRNRWTMIAVTYDGSRVAAGLSIYVNGVLDTTAVKTNIATYGTNAYATANLRTRFGGSQKSGSNGFYGGQSCEISVWNAVLSGAELTELYNEGQPKTASECAFYAAKCIEYFPLSTDYNGVKLGIALTASNSTIVSSYVSTALESISFMKHSDTNTRYIAFGGLRHVSGTTYAWDGRDGVSHFLEGNMHHSVKDINSFITNAVNSTVITEATTERVSGVASGNINGSAFLFYSRFDDSGAGTFIDVGRRVSSDGLVGAAFGAYIGSMGNVYPRFEFYGKVVDGFSAGHYFVPFFEHNNDVEWRISVFKTTDNGANWSKIQVVDSLTKLGEAALLNVGNNTLLIVCRKNDSNNLWQIKSTDGGGTWGAPAATNLGIGISNGDMCLTDDGKINLVYMSRTAARGLYISRDNVVATVLANPLAWNAGELLFKSYTTDANNILGYPSILNVGNGYFLMTVAAEFSSSRADLFWGYGKLTMLGG